MQLCHLRAGVSRFRVNVFVQQQHVVWSFAPSLPRYPTSRNSACPSTQRSHHEKRGLVLVVGGTGSGKSTSLAAMIDHRNRTSKGTSSLSKIRWNMCTNPSNR